MRRPENLPYCVRGEERAELGSCYAKAPVNAITTVIIEIITAPVAPAMVI